MYGSVNPSRQGELPPPVQNCLSENDPVYFILDTVTEMDISAITAKYEQEQKGLMPHSPRMIVALLLYSYFGGIFSSRKIVQACHERLTFRAIVGDNIPNWRTIRNFRKLHMKELEGLFVQVLKLCQKAGLVELGHSGPDGTEVKAKAGRQKGASYCQMKKEEQRLQHEIHRLLSEAEAVDQQEDQLYVTDPGRKESTGHSIHQQNSPEWMWRVKGKLKTEDKNSVKQAKTDIRGDRRPNQGKKHTVILDISGDSEIRPPTWEEAARKCAEVYREVIAEHKSCRETS